MPSVTKVTITSDDYKIADGTRTGTRVYRVDFDTGGWTHAQARIASQGGTSIDAIGDGFDGPTDLAKAVEINSRRDISQRTHTRAIVTVGYSSRAEDQEQTIENPLARPVQFAYDGSLVEEPYFRDTDGNPNTNSAGEDFLDLPQRLRPDATFTFTRNVAAYDDAKRRSFLGHTNSNATTLNGRTYAAGTLLVSKWSSSGPNTENDVTFWTETIQVTEAPEGQTWDDEFEDRGYHELDSGELVPIVGADGQPVRTPYPLDGSGSKQASPTDTPATIVRKPYEATSFAGI